MTTHDCPGCGSSHCDLFYEVRGIPANSCRVGSTRAEATASDRGDIELRFCDRCGAVFNATFDPGLIKRTRACDQPNAHSRTFGTLHRHLADQLVERYQLRGKDILEIGCGKGELLTLLCELGDNHGVGFDPSYVPDLYVSPAGNRTTFRREPFTEDTVARPTDVVLSKMLGQVPDTARYLRLLRRTVIQRKQARLFLQMPEIARILKECAFWDIHYQQCSYFSAGTLERLLRAEGFTVDDVWTGFDDQYLMADARPVTNGAAGTSSSDLVETVADLERLVARFIHACREKQAMWRETLTEVANAGNQIAIWGSGCKTVSFLTTLSIGDEIQYVVDFNPHRQGKYLPGTGHPIVAPAVIAAARPDVVIVMNPVYAVEIQELLTQTGCAPTLLIA